MTPEMIYKNQIDYKMLLSDELKYNIIFLKRENYTLNQFDR